MSWTISRRNYLRGTAALAGAALVSRRAFAAGPLAYQGELALVSQAKSPPDQALVALIEAFEAANPGIKVTSTFLPPDQFAALFAARQAAGEPVDLLLLNGFDLRRYAVSGTLAELDAVAGDTSRFAPAALETGHIGGKLWGLPYGWYGGFPLFYNRAILEAHNIALPKTYADFLPIRDTLKAAGINTFTHPGKLIYLWPVWFFTTFAQASGNQAIPRTIEILSGKGKFTDDDVVKALDLIFQFGKDGLLPSSVLGLEIANAVTEFSTGRAAFFMHHDSFIDALSKANPQGVDLDVILMPPLTDNGAKSQFPGGPGGMLALPATTTGDKRDAAVALIQLLTSDASDQMIVEKNNGTVPVNLKAVVKGDVPVVQKLVGLSDNLINYLDWFWPPEVSRAFQEGIQAGVAGQRSGKDVAEKIQSTFDRLVAGGYVFDKQS